MTTEPVTIGNIVTFVFAIFGTLLAKWGFSESDVTQIVGLVGAIISSFIAAISWWKQRSAVTPLKRPQNNEGTPLIPDPNLSEAA